MHHSAQTIASMPQFATSIRLDQLGALEHEARLDAGKYMVFERHLTHNENSPGSHVHPLTCW